MSGGRVYVRRVAPPRVNRELVDLEPLATDDKRALRDLVERHHQETGSPVAAGLLADWGSAVAEFTMVMPRDYKKVMEAIRTAEAAGRDIDDAVMGAARG